MPLALMTRIFVRVPAAVRTGVIPAAIVAGPGALRTIVPAMGIVTGLGRAAAVHLVARHRTIVGSATIFRPRRRTSFLMAKGRSVIAGGHYSGAVEFSRTRGGGDVGPAVILRCQKPAIAASIALMVALRVGRFKVAFAIPRFLLAVRAGVDSAAAAVVADAVHGHVVDDGLVVHANVGDVDVVHGAVVVEVAVSPIAAFITVAEVAVAVVHATVEADVRSPVPGVPDVHAVAPSPISGRPEHAHRGRHHPCARDPVVAFRTVGPVAGGPDVTVTGTGRLFVNREHWGRDGHGNGNTRERRSRKQQGQKSERGKTQNTH